jgi:erythromycin esterase-like protein
MRTLILSLVVILSGAQDVLPQIPNYTEISISKDGSQQIDFLKLEFLKSELENADIVLLGEPSHTPQYYDIKIQLVKYLHEQLGFDVLAFESGLYQMETANSEIKKGGSVYSAFENSLFPIWTSQEEFQKLYGYLDSLRHAGDAFDIAGFDFQVSAYYASKKFVLELQNALQNNQISFSLKPFDILQSQFENLETGEKGLTEDFNEESITELRRLAESLRSDAALDLYYQSLVGWIAHFSDLYRNNLAKKIKEGTFQGKDSNIRDSLMAMNMIYLHEKLYPGKKIIGWGANGHFANKVKTINTWVSESRQFVGMGSHLKQKLGDKVFFLAVTTDNNYPGTIERELSEKGIELAWISKPDMTKSDFASCLLGRPSSGNWDEVVDGILYFNSSEQVIPKSRNSYFIKGNVLNAREENESVAFASFSIVGTTKGTASNVDGEYNLKIDSADLQKTINISSIGFKTRSITVKSLLEVKTIFLIPEIELLKEVLVQGKRPDANEILQQAIENIPNNYLQIPFNMEFFAENTVLDTTDNKSFTLESVFSSYYEGYHKAAKKNYRILQKRESGTYYMKEKMHGLAQWPMWEMAFNDIFSNQSEHQIVTLESLKKIEPKLIGTQLYDGDTVFVIRYNYKVAGTIYVSSKDYAILKHVINASGRGYKNRTEILYRRQDGKYFPYAANGDYLHQYKVDGVRKFLKISNRTRLIGIETEDVTPFEHRQELWVPKDVEYDPEYWNKYYPKANE